MRERERREERDGERMDDGETETTRDDYLEKADDWTVDVVCVDCFSMFCVSDSL